MSEQSASLHPQVVTALAELARALSRAKEHPEAGQAEAEQAVSETTPAQADPEPAASPRFSLEASAVQTDAGPALMPPEGVPGAIPARPTGRIRSRKLWTMVGTVATLVVNNAAGLELSPLAQGLIAGVAGLYIIVQAAVDSVRIKK